MTGSGPISASGTRLPPKVHLVGDLGGEVRDLLDARLGPLGEDAGEHPQLPDAGLLELRLRLDNFDLDDLEQAAVGLATAGDLDTRTGEVRLCQAPAEIGAVPRCYTTGAAWQ